MSDTPTIDALVRVFKAIGDFSWPDAAFWWFVAEMLLNYAIGVLFLYCVMAVLFGPLFFMGIYGWTKEERDRCRAYDRRHR